MSFSSYFVAANLQRLAFILLWFVFVGKLTTNRKVCCRLLLIVAVCCIPSPRFLPCSSRAQNNFQLHADDEQKGLSPIVADCCIPSPTFLQNNFKLHADDEQKGLSPIVADCCIPSSTFLPCSPLAQNIFSIATKYGCC